jgi:hypothetical protein
MDNPEKLATYGTQDEGAIKHGQSRETGNIGYTRRRDNQTWTIQRNWHHRVHKTKGQSMLPVSLDCPCLIAPSSCVPYVASFSGLSMFDCPFVLCTLCCQFIWKTGNIGYTRRKGNQTWTIQRNWQHRVHKTKGQSNMDNPEKLAT